MIKRERVKKIRGIKRKEEKKKKKEKVLKYIKISKIWTHNQLRKVLIKKEKKKVSVFFSAIFHNANVVLLGGSCDWRPLL